LKTPDTVFCALPLVIFSSLTALNTIYEGINLKSQASLLRTPHSYFKLLPTWHLCFDVWLASETFFKKPGASDSLCNPCYFGSWGQKTMIWG
jgi:hypothetical protein